MWADFLCLHVNTQIMTSRLIRFLLLFVTCAFFYSADALANPYVFGNVRITVITEGLVRMEYAVDGKFNDDRTMFAWNRDRLYKDCKIEQVDSIKYIISTPKMKITL